MTVRRGYPDDEGQQRTQWVEPDQACCLDARPAPWSSLACGTWAAGSAAPRRPRSAVVSGKPTGEPIVPNTDYHHWKALLVAAEVREGRLHDARHPAGTVLLLLSIPDRIVDSIMGWEPGGSARMRARYMHVTDPMLRKVAGQVGAALWGAPEGAEDPK